VAEIPGGKKKEETCKDRMYWDRERGERTKNEIFRYLEGERTKEGSG